MWQQTQAERDLIPSHTALEQRACRVVNMWNHASNSEIQFLPMEKYGWLKADNAQGWKFQWIQRSISSVLEDECKKGCHGRCGCRQKGQLCGARCKCINCSNLNTPSSGSELHSSQTPNETEDHMQTADDHELVTMFEELDEDMVIK